MSFLRLVYLISVVLATCSQQTHVLASQFLDPGNDSNFREFPCPNAEDIAPCVCTFHVLFAAMDMDCDKIADEQQLYNVFHANMVVHKFRKLNLDADNLKTLNDTVFGKASFEKVRAHSGILASIGPETFLKSASTLRVIDLYNNELTDFPFETLSQYTELTELDLSKNPISSFPIIQSESLRVLNLHYTEFDTIPSGALDGLPNLEEIDASHTHADSISMATGLFTSLDNITTIDMDSTGLVHLKSLQFEVSNPDIHLIGLKFNDITTVDEDTFRGVQSGTINIEYNQLSILPETTWRPVIDAGVKLELHGNDLTCGCDVAWLVLEPTYHELVKDAECQSGEKLVDLKPSDFENCTY